MVLHRDERRKDVEDVSDPSNPHRRLPPTLGLLLTWSTEFGYERPVGVQVVRS